MFVIRNMAIKQKLMLIIMATCTGALLLASIVQLLFERREYRKETVRTMSCYAEMIGDNCKAALAFEDARDAQETLTSLRTESSIVFACVYTKEGKVLAHYQHPDITDEISPPVCKKESYKFDNNYFNLFKQIKDNGEIISTVYIRLNLYKMKAMLWLKAGTIALIVLMCSLIAYLVSSKLQSIISGPILDLAEVAKAVSEKKNYSVRALKRSNDEVGLLIDAFNEMLEQIQQRDLALVDAKDQLEIRVEHRTAELTTTNEQLTKEIGERKKAEEALRESENKYRTLLENLPQRIFSKDRNSIYVSCNENFARDLGIRVEEFKGKTDYDFFPKELAEKYRGDDKRIMEAGTTEDIEEKYIRNGQEMIVQTVKTPIKDEQDNIVGVLGIFWDITNLKHAEAELKAAQEKLIETARRAGMAEVAADVLHNVGNVLNSINVSTTVIREKVTNSELANLEKVANIINEHTDDLGTFLTEDPQGKHIPVYLTEVSKYLTDEQTDIIAKLKVLTENVQHIKDIVSMQQSYAKVSGVEVHTSLSKLAEDAIQINSAGLQRHGVRLIREFEEIGEAEIDRQKALQILVNLISNAKYALSGSNREEKLLTIRIYKHCEDRFRIEVADNGVGISEENLAKIFNYGFTTKKDGHGVGLHSSALAAKEIGGTLTVYSEGLEQGATFMLELPFKPVEVMR